MNNQKVLKTVIHDSFNQTWISFEDSQEVITCNNISNITESFDYVQKKCILENYYAAGFISYNASPAFDYALKVKDIGSNQNVPLLWFALFKNIRPIQLVIPNSNAIYLSNWKQRVSNSEYKKAIKTIKNHIYLGNTYQVNYTMRQEVKFSGNYWDFFCELAWSQRSKYAAFIETEDFVVCSASPELFFTFDKGTIISKPMKGTAPRGLTYEEDLQMAQWLYNSEKNRAENVMIVDMIRNDLNKVAEPKTVKAVTLFEVEKYPTVWQMTTTVIGYTKKTLTNVMTSLFPCASITGAPKANTMKIISEVEHDSRNLYSGTIGFITPDKKSQFNVAIRTIFINKKDNTAEYGVGGGIVWDSTTEEEYDECLIKSRFLSYKTPHFSILESILWTPEENYFLLNYHIERMKKSAKYFDFTFDEKNLLLKLQNYSAFLQQTPHKIRVLLDEKGKIFIESSVITEENRDLNVTVYNKNIKTKNPFIYHKTTNRQIYDNIKCLYPNYDEVILYNEKEELTEGLFSNIVVKIDNELFTPPVKCGLLGGCYRQYLIDSNKLKEKVITLKELSLVDEIFLINSVRKFRKAKLENSTLHKVQSSG